MSPAITECGTKARKRSATVPRIIAPVDSMPACASSARSVTGCGYRLFDLGLVTLVAGFLVLGLNVGLIKAIKYYWFEVIVVISYLILFFEGDNHS